MRQIINEQLQISESNPIKARYYDYDRFTYPWHFHSQYEIIYVRNSSGRCFVGDCIERFSDGDVILFGPNLPHYMRSDDAYHCGNSLLRVQGTIIQFEENFMQYSFDHYPQFHQIRLLLKEATGDCLAETLKTALADPQLLARMRGACLERRDEMVTLERYCDQLEALYQRDFVSESGEA